MSCCRTSKQELASPVDIVMVRLWVPPTVILRTSFERDRAMACDVLLGFWPQHSKVLQWCHSESRMLRQGGVIQIFLVSGYGESRSGGSTTNSWMRICRISKQVIASPVIYRRHSNERVVVLAPMLGRAIA
ncbi:hypothetical protein AVEN_160880-1 [Araneus ventricosus]|uniref:Uncharacterized protein n=1 Tax=Araneus ventricosus TaxID=182803 RepID=A0A4Y2V0V4_ARAVE|nr:hypothetical protein AVEN_160880-1 [Araneus ventricosus]